MFVIKIISLIFKIFIVYLRAFFYFYFTIILLQVLTINLVFNLTIEQYIYINKLCEKLLLLINNK